MALHWPRGRCERCEQLRILISEPSNEDEPYIGRLALTHAATLAVASFSYSLLTFSYSYCTATRPRPHVSSATYRTERTQSSPRPYIRPGAWRHMLPPPSYIPVQWSVLYVVRFFPLTLYLHTLRVLNTDGQIVVYAVVLFGLWNVPGARVIINPLKLFAIGWHEVSHAALVRHISAEPLSRI